MEKKNRENTFTRVMGGRGFYAVLLICMVGVGASGIIVARNTDFFGASLSKKEELPDNDSLIVITPPPTKAPVTKAPETKPPAKAPVTKAPDEAPSVKMPADRDSSEAETSAAQDERETPASVTPKNVLYVKPCLGDISSPFDADELVFSQTMKDWRCHMGVDVAAQVGAQVKATADGEVRDVGYDEMKGYYVSISHGGGMESLYCNLSSQILVDTGDAVSAGQVIGGVGESAPFEQAEPSHLHFEFIKEGKNVDPLDYIKGY